MAVIIPKPDSGERLLGIPAVIDRMIQQAISQVNSPYFEPIFSPQSYGYRPGKSARHAVAHVQTCIKQGYKTAVDIDLSKFFDEVNHDMLMNRIGPKIKDKAIIQLIVRHLRATISRVVIPFAYRLNTLSSMEVKRVCCFLITEVQKCLPYHGEFQVRTVHHQ